MYLACLLATLAALPQDPPHEPTMLERIDALIAKSNAYEHFVVHYHLHSIKDGEADLRVVFSNPDRARITFTGTKSTTDAVFHGVTMEMRVHGDGAPAQTATVRNVNEEAAARTFVRSMLVEAFPKRVPTDDFPAADFFSFLISLDSDCTGLGFASAWGDSARLLWLGTMRKELSKLSVVEGEPELIAYSSCDDVRAFVSAENGFMTRVEKDMPEGVHVTLELVELDLDASPEAEGFELAAAEQGTRDTSAEAGADLATRGFARGRDTLFDLVARMLDGNKIEWSDEVSERIGKILHALASREMKPMFQLGAAQNLEWLDRMDQWVVTALEQPGGRGPEQLDALRKQVAQARESLEATVSQGPEKLRLHAYPRDRCKARPALSDEFAAMEKRIVSETFAEEVTKPLLAAFDERMAKQLDAK